MLLRRTPEGGVGAQDVSLLKQAVLNLLINALQAMEEAPGENKELIVRSRATRRNKDPRHRPGGDHPSRVEEIFRPYVSSKSGGSGRTAYHQADRHGWRQHRGIRSKVRKHHHQDAGRGSAAGETHDLSRKSF